MKSIKIYSIRLGQVVLLYLITNLFVFMLFQLGYSFCNGFTILPQTVREAVVVIGTILFTVVSYMWFTHEFKES
jgi:hypothetical protein